MFLIEHHHQDNKDCMKLFTCSSKSQNGVGCTVIHKDESNIANLPDCVSVFTAELAALNKALELKL